MIYTKDDFQKLFDVPAEMFESIETYHALLLKWNKAINLVSPKTLNESWHRHIIDSAQVEKFIPQKTKTETKIYADLGCGGGFPGLVIAMMRPELDVHLVESDERKCQFMRSVARETALINVTIHTKRIEDVIDDITPDLITARALASLDKLFDYILPWTAQSPDLRMVFMKGQKAEEEITEAQKRYHFDHKSTQSITDENAHILEIKNLNKH